MTWTKQSSPASPWSVRSPAAPNWTPRTAIPVVWTSTTATIPVWDVEPQETPVIAARWDTGHLTWDSGQRWDAATDEIWTRSP